MLGRIGRVLRVAAAWPTVERPLARSCCLQLIFTVVVSYTMAVITHHAAAPAGRPWAFTSVASSMVLFSIHPSDNGRRGPCTVRACAAHALSGASRYLLQSAC